MQTMTTARAILHCPDGCELEPGQHVPEFNDGKLCVWHQGPTFGYFTMTTTTRDGMAEPLVADLDGVELTAEELRKVAVDALAAADWLESRA